MNNRRQFTRILFSIKATLQVGEQSYPVSIHDISLNGALVSVVNSEQSLKGQLGMLYFLLNEDQPETEVTMHIAVVHEDSNDIGLQCNAIDIDSITILRRLVELNLGDESQLNRELAQLSHDQSET